MEARRMTVASTPSFHELQCMYWQGSRTSLVLLPNQGSREVSFSQTVTHKGLGGHSIYFEFVAPLADQTTERRNDS